MENIVQLLSDPQKAATHAGWLISGGASDNKIQIGCNIDQLRHFVNVSFFDVSFPDKNRGGGGLFP